MTFAYSWQSLTPAKLAENKDKFNSGMLVIVNPLPPARPPAPRLPPPRPAALLGRVGFDQA